MNSCLGVKTETLAADKGSREPGARWDQLPCLVFWADGTFLTPLMGYLQVTGNHVCVCSHVGLSLYSQGDPQSVPRMAEPRWTWVLLLAHLFDYV